MTVDDMKDYLEAHGVAPESLYSHGGFGGQPEVVGIEFIEGYWHTYDTERGSKQFYKKWDSEAEAVAYVIEEVEDIARALGVWRE